MPAHLSCRLIYYTPTLLWRDSIAMPSTPIARPAMPRHHFSEGLATARQIYTATAPTDILSGFSGHTPVISRIEMALLACLPLKAHIARCPLG